MFAITEKQLHKLFYFICLLLASLMTFWAILEYVKNEDVIEISYRKFDQTKGDSQYPAMSLCFVDYYNQSSFEMSNHDEKTFNITSYSDFINGDIWEEENVSSGL